MSQRVDKQGKQQGYQQSQGQQNYRPPPTLVESEFEDGVVAKSPGAALQGKQRIREALIESGETHRQKTDCQNNENRHQMCGCRPAAGGWENPHARYSLASAHARVAGRAPSR